MTIMIVTVNMITVIMKTALTDIGQSAMVRSISCSRSLKGPIRVPSRPTPRRSHKKTPF